MTPQKWKDTLWYAHKKRRSKQKLSSKLNESLPGVVLNQYILIAMVIHNKNSVGLILFFSASQSCREFYHHLVKQGDISWSILHIIGTLQLSEHWKIVQAIFTKDQYFSLHKMICLFVSITGYSLLQAPTREWIFACTAVCTPASRAVMLRLRGDKMINSTGKGGQKCYCRHIRGKKRLHVSNKVLPQFTSLICFKTQSTDPIAHSI